MKHRDAKYNPTIGFISPPAWYDPAPSEFPSVVETKVYTQQALLPEPDFDYRLTSIASIQPALHVCAHSLCAIGCDVIAQVGSPFAWAGAPSEAAARSRQESLYNLTTTPIIMTGLAIVDALRSLGIQKVAVTCTYYNSEWCDTFKSFLAMCGFDVMHIATLADQGLTTAHASMRDDGWSMTPERTSKSILAVAAAAPYAQAIVVTGAGARTLDSLVEMETHTQRPIIAADTILYWAIAQELHLPLKPIMGSWAKRTNQSKRVPRQDHQT